MDADSRKRSRNLSLREKRWSMNSQRLDQIVAELMKPISDVRRNFDTDLSALLEEYLTEAGLHALDSEEQEINTAIPNFTEVALLLQQSASIYSRKVDFLYQHVLSISDSLQNSTQEAEAESPNIQSRVRRRKPSAFAAEFSAITLAPCASASRDAAPPRPPPTLPRMYVELEPRVLRRDDFPLLDYGGEPVGLLADYQVARRLHRGLLLHELAVGDHDAGTARIAPLHELQSAIDEAAPPWLLATTPCAPPSPSSPSSPPATPTATLECCVLAKRKRKQHSDLNLEDCQNSPINLHISKKLRRCLAELSEFSLPACWVRRVLGERRRALRAMRARLSLPRALPAGFLGFESPDPRDIGGFMGWSQSEAELSAASAQCAATEAALRRADSDDDDDGFFEQSSLGDSDVSRTEEAAPDGDGAGRGVDVARCAAAVLGAATRLAPRGAARWEPLLRVAAHEPADVSRLFLATLFLANAGNVELVPGAALALGSFGVRVLTTDERLYRSLAADHRLVPN